MPPEKQPKIEIQIDLNTLLVEEVKLRDDKGSPPRTMIANESPANLDVKLRDKIDYIPDPDEDKPPLREKQITVLHANPTYIVIGGRIYCW